MIDREINLLDSQDIDQYLEECQKTARMEEKLQSYGSPVNGGYMLTIGQMAKFFKEAKKC